MTISTPGVGVDAHRHTGHLIRRAQQIHTYLWSAEVSKEVTSTQFAVLSAVALNPETDQNALSREVSLDTSTVGAVVNRLIDRGLLRRDRDPGDRRRNLLSLTDAGHALFGELSVRAARMTEGMVGCLPPEDREELVRILSRVVDAGEAKRESAEHTR
ncbi:MarR family winged helix-turn-helix transcriptional regulator [Amycolatopsis albispora]|uniref:HTH marR-type domain-containing protein n=1 Tax=Amycolatopsis albispora TaxID=1804986 RepID=A0A344L8P3_9PSEU|nr:MarR family winged helix-turn-helix transcriptional regulator [Amycolatopsis albispora]AXB44417.1 hypothetical protein A4R43_19395 [Amycolatopsis albispora]